jgi:O-antigen/teichoic acid export membrane protein
MIGLAPNLIEHIFGPKWTAATGAVQATLFGVLPLALSLLVAAAMQARGRAVPRLRCAVIASVATLLVVYPLMLAAGVTGAAIASAVVAPAVDLLLLARIAAIPLRRAACDGTIALVAVGGLSLLIAHEADTAPILAVGCVAIVILAMPLMWAIDRAILKYAWGLLRHRDVAAAP